MLYFIDMCSSWLFVIGTIVRRKTVKNGQSGYQAASRLSVFGKFLVGVGRSVCDSRCFYFFRLN